MYQIFTFDGVGGNAVRREGMEGVDLPHTYLGRLSDVVYQISMAQALYVEVDVDALAAVLAHGKEVDEEAFANMFKPGSSPYSGEHYTSPEPALKMLNEAIDAMTNAGVHIDDVDAFTTSFHTALQAAADQDHLEVSVGE